MHATNEQCALIMGWTLEESGWYDIPDHRGNWTYSNKPESLLAFFDPTHDLNHAALVEARLAELEHDTYYTHRLKLLILRQKGICNEYDMITASAQTRCDAAWATWQAMTKARQALAAKDTQ